MRDVIVWLKRHLTVIGILSIALSGIVFSFIYKINQNQPPGQVTVKNDEVSIILQSASIGIWVVLAIILGAGGIALAGYSMLKKRDKADALGRGFKEMLKRK